LKCLQIASCVVSSDGILSLVAQSRGPNDWLKTPANRHFHGRSCARPHEEGRIRRIAADAVESQAVGVPIPGGSGGRGIDISAFPEPLADEVVITMGCSDACPLCPGKRYEDSRLDAPRDKRIEAFLVELVPADESAAQRGEGSSKWPGSRARVRCVDTCPSAEIRRDFRSARTTASCPERACRS
jgi:hypothetical protein